MARIVIASVPVTGHVTPLLPIARALVEAGHDVRWTSGTKHQARIAATGARFLPYRHTLDIEESRINEAFPGREGLSGLAAIKFDIRHVFLGLAPTMLQDLEALHAEQAMDLLIADMAFIGAQFFHERTKLPFLALNVVPLSISSRDVAPFGMALPPSATRLGRLRNRALQTLMQDVLLRSERDFYHDLRRRAGFLPRGWFMDFHERASTVLHPSIPSLEYPRSDLPSNVHFIGMLPLEPPRDVQLPTWFGELAGDRPVVHVTQGTLANQAPLLFKPAIEGLRSERVLVVVTTGGRPAAELGLTNLPENVRVASFIPYAQLLPKTRVMITNGGFGGVQLALSHGVPLIVAGDTEDKPEIAARLTYARGGIDLRTGKPSARQIARAVRRALADSALLARGQELRAEYARYDALALALEHIDRLLGRAPRLATAVEARGSAREQNLDAGSAY
jgi:MGT family glycosyltransferase